MHQGGDLWATRESCGGDAAGASSSSAVAAPKLRCGGPDGCYYLRVESLICSLHGISSLYVCRECENYHVCDGGDDCIVVNTGDNMVCFLTGNCVADNIQEFCNLSVAVKKKDLECAPTDDVNTFMGIAEAIKRDIFAFFNRENCKLAEIRAAILTEEGLRPEIGRLIEVTLRVSIHIFSKSEHGYDVICSMYVQIIISIYSTKTVYNGLLFKCTKNKRYDSVLKKMRELWMSTSATGGSAVAYATG
ncbi:protein UL92 [Equid gammaherpesvirus 5]|uniref:Protein UL92 n=1 Tax=Equid gammaherpesvirus 5 TaxID=10371 RepID=A0A0B4Q6Q8_9GAMA|nr:protein UL92 [Equid gammaherpesvirus 5]AIU39556.1 protein UL92 [Equid gammaherpesvirus 5]APT43418.1 protein UL92 [Equid gammaherpesvirus 5]